MKVSVSFLKSEFDTKTTIKKIDSSSADYLHVDLMDGDFVAAKNYTAGEITKLLSNVTKSLDVHLMVSNPLKYLEIFASLNTEYLTFHYEAVTKPLDVIDKIKELGLKVGISIKPKTKVSEIIEFLPLLDQVLVMSVEPGLGGQEFMESAIEKIEELKTLRETNNYSYIISVDGGINAETADLVKDAGADMVASGYYICSSDNFDNQIDNLR